MELLPLSHDPGGYETWKCWTCNVGGEGPHPPGGFDAHSRTRGHRRALFRAEVRDAWSHFAAAAKALFS